MILPQKFCWGYYIKKEERERENSSRLPTLEKTLPIISVFAAILAENEKSRDGRQGVVHRSKKDCAHPYSPRQISI